MRICCQSFTMEAAKNYNKTITQHRFSSSAQEATKLVAIVELLEWLYLVLNDRMVSTGTIDHFQVSIIFTSGTVSVSPANKTASITRSEQNRAAHSDIESVLSKITFSTARNTPFTIGAHHWPTQRHSTKSRSETVFWCFAD